MEQRCALPPRRGLKRISHGMTKTKEYRAWRAMKQRTTNPTYPKYHNYATRGIRVCDRWWFSFENFFEDMGFAPTPKHSIDRINNEGDYELSNCRWATYCEQNLNRRGVRSIEFDGKTQTVNEWSYEYGICRSTIITRLLRGWTVEKTLTQPILKRKRKLAA